MIKVLGLSDLHGHWKEYIEQIPEIELLILSGDFCSTDNIEDQEKEIPEMIKHFWTIFPDLQEIIIVPGNHDYYLERLWKAEKCNQYPVLGYGVRLLVDSSYEYCSPWSGENIKIWGYPRTTLGFCAFPSYYHEQPVDRIPGGLDILVTHEAPRFYDLKCIRDSIGWYGFSEPGSEKLYNRVCKVKPRYHFFGHIHINCCGENEWTKFYNNSQLRGENFDPIIRTLEFLKYE